MDITAEIIDLTSLFDVFIKNKKDNIEVIKYDSQYNAEIAIYESYYPYKIVNYDNDNIISIEYYKSSNNEENKYNAKMLPLIAIKNNKRIHFKSSKHAQDWCKTIGGFIDVKHIGLWINDNKLHGEYLWYYNTFAPSLPNEIWIKINSFKSYDKKILSIIIDDENKLFNLLEVSDNYEVSNMGRYKNKNNIISDSRFYNLKKNDNVVISIDNMQYDLEVLILIAFQVFKEDKKQFIIHIDNNKNNNCLDNLRYSYAVNGNDREKKIEYTVIIENDTKISINQEIQDNPSYNIDNYNKDSNEDVDSELEYDEDDWKIIDNYPEYQISTLGHIISTKNDDVIKLKPNKCRNGYYSIQLGSNKNPHMLIHRIVAQTFIPNPENKECVNHKNRNRRDNRVENLEWTSASENMQHSYDTDETKRSTSRLNIIQGTRNDKKFKRIIIEHYREHGLYNGIRIVGNTIYVDGTFYTQIHPCITRESATQWFKENMKIRAHISECISDPEKFESAGGYTWKSITDISDLPNETWRNIGDIKDIYIDGDKRYNKNYIKYNNYLISNYGRVKEPSGYIRDTRYFKTLENYIKTVIYGDNLKIHELVLLAFMGNRPSISHDVFHINRNRYDNHLENLKWLSKSEFVQSDMVLLSNGYDHRTTQVFKYDMDNIELSPIIYKSVNDAIILENTTKRNIDTWCELGGKNKTRPNTSYLYLKNK
jgi:hypothetical protein